MGSSPSGTYRERDRRAVEQFKPHRFIYERRIAWFAVLSGLPGIAVGTILIWVQPWSVEAKVGLTTVELVLWSILIVTLLEQIVRPLQTLSNVVSALGEEDYSFRARDASLNDCLLYTSDAADE